jgi:FixJ family two-component response regulator
MRKGAFDFLTKPVEKKQLLEVIEKALAREAATREIDTWARELKERYASLTPTEKKIYRMVVDGLPNKAIAAQMGNAERTVKLHRSNLSRKMGAQCGADLVRLYFEGELG